MSHVPNMIEKTLRYPGCVEYIKVLRETGFFSYDEMILMEKKLDPLTLLQNFYFQNGK